MPKDNVTRFINSHIYDTFSEQSLTTDGFNRLRTYLGRAKEGNFKIYTAPFAKGESMQKVLNDWMRVLVSNLSQWPSLLEFERDLANKVGPLSVQMPLWARIPDIAHYYDDILLSSKPVDSRAIKAVTREFSGLSGLRLRSVDQTVEAMRLSTNSGMPFYKPKRRDVLQDTIPCESWASLGTHPSVHAELPNSDWEVAAVVGWRGQEGGMSEEDVKQRVIWMFPFSVNINELQVYQPLIEGAQSLNLVPAWVSMESVDERVTKLFDTKEANDLVVCTDFSKFDQHFNPDMSEAAKSILCNLLSGDATSEEWLSYVYPIKYNIPMCLDAFIRNGETIILCSKGLHGMASGSGGTNVDETLAHRALQYEAAILNKRRLNPNSMCLGDDGILTYPGITVEDVVQAYESHGQECNLSKQYAATDHCVYLRRWHHQNYRQQGICVGVYSTCRALGRLRYLERFMDPELWGKEAVALRQLSIIENCKWHPLREQFVQFCMKRDRYRLGMDIPGFLENIVEITRESIELMPDFLGYTKTMQGFRASGIAEWWIVKYLKSQK